nr:hypothetical protein GCM10017547_36990 [Pseudarthrobacter oxydans]
MLWRKMYGRWMRAELIDPRDQTLQVNDPTYRVYFWAEDAAKQEWELSGADLNEVLEWIPAHSRGRSHSLWAVTRLPGEVCLVRLQGIDLDTRPDAWPSWARRVNL